MFIVEWPDPDGIGRTFHDTEHAAQVARRHRLEAGVKHAVVYEWDDPGSDRPRSEAACWLNADCERGHHGCLDEDGCQFVTTSGDLR